MSRTGFAFKPEVSPLVDDSSHAQEEGKQAKKDTSPRLVRRRTLKDRLESINLRVDVG